MGSHTPKVVLATDLDGTLLRSDGTVSERTRAAIAAARESSVEVVFITGRPPGYLETIHAETGHQGTVICANGAVLLGTAPGSQHQVSAFTPADVATIWDSLVAAVPDGQYCSMMLHPNGEPERLLGSGTGYLDIVADRVSQGWQVYKLALFGPQGHSADSFLAVTTAAVGEISEVTHSSYGVPLAEIGPKGITKGSALSAFATERGVSLDSVHAVGDMPNDLPMLAVAGRAYAVANAHERVRAAVDEVIGKNDEDGVAVLLERLLNQDLPFTEI